MHADAAADDPPVQQIPLPEIELDPLNPNEMSDVQLYELQADIRKFGFDEPVLLVPHPDKPGKYRCVSGEHRVKVMRILKRGTVPAIVRDWDDQTAAIYMVRRNMLRGSMNRTKLRNLVDERLGGFSVEELAKQMAFKREQDLAALLAAQSGGRMVQQEAFEEAAALGDTAKKDIVALKSLGDMVSKIYGESCGTVANDYLAFGLEGRAHFLVLADDRLFKQLSALADECREAGTSMCAALADALDHIGA